MGMLSVPGLLLLVWLTCATVGSAHGGKVLVMPVDGSHWLSMKLLVSALAHGGHEVVLLVPESNLMISGSDAYRTETFPVPYTQEELTKGTDALKNSAFVKRSAINDFVVNVQRLMAFTSLQVTGCESLLYNGTLVSQLRGEGFDVMLTDPFLPCGAILAETLSIPAVYFMWGLPCGLQDQATQCPSPPSYVPRFFSGQTDKMNFGQRVLNTVVYVMDLILCRVIYHRFDELTTRYLEKDISYGELLGKGAIWLLRYDFTFEWPKPLMPNMVLIGGINCKKPHSLPADVEEFVEGSGEDGFIVFSLGSMVSSIPEETAKQFFDAFRQIPQRVVWRSTGAVPKDAPKNVKLMEWLPQNDLLAHPKAKAFIAHGGTHGIYEAICNGVPMVMMPLFGDQGHNVHQMVARGVAVAVNVFDVTSGDLVEALHTVINNSSYKERMARLSAVHRDRPVEPLDLAVFWTEFVMRHGGAEHLRVAAHHLGWAQYHSLDVLALLGLLGLLGLAAGLLTCWFCARKLCRRVAAAKRKSD